MKKKITYLISLLSLSAIGLSQTTLEHYKFDNGSVNGENGSIGNSSSPLDKIANYKGEANKAINLTGNSFTLGSPTINTSNGISFSFWIKPKANLPANTIILSQRDVCTGTNMFNINLRGSTQTVSLELRTPNGATSLHVNYTPNAWQKITFTVDKSNTKVYAYVDGLLRTTGSLNIMTLANTYANTPIRVASTVCAHSKYKGGLDEFRIYESTLTTAQVKNAFTSDGVSFDELYLLTHYKFDSTIISEEKINTPNPNANLTDRNQIANSATNLAGGNFDLDPVNINTNNGITFSFWIKPLASLAGDKIVLSRRSVCTGTNMFNINLNGSTQKVGIELRTPIGASGLWVAYTPGVWQKITFSVDKTNAKIRAYVNGVLLQTGNLTASTLAPTFTGTIKVASSVCNKNPYKGGLDDVFIYPSKLTDLQISNAYTTDNDNQYNFSYKETFQSGLTNFTNPTLPIIGRTIGNTNSVDNALLLSGQSYDLGNPNIFTGQKLGYTFSFWIKPDVSLTGNTVVFGKRAICNHTNMFLVNLNGSTKKISLELRRSTGQVVTHSIGYTPGVWQQIVFIVNLDGNYITTFHNGAEGSTKMMGGNEVSLSYTPTLKIAKSACPVAPYQGGLDEIKIYRIPLNSQKILDNYNSVITNVFSTETVKKATIYPNPVITELTIMQDNLLSVDVLNLNGMRVLSSGNNKVDVSSLENGVYLIQLNTKNGVLTQKIIKQ